MKALTLKQPWAWAVAHAGKDVENRTWRPPKSIIGQRIAIHAGLARERSALRNAGITNIETPLFLDRGAIVAVATIFGYICDGGWSTGTRKGSSSSHASDIEIVMASMSRWYVGDSYGWVLTDVIALQEPIDCKGQQGLWTVPPEVEAEINRQIRDLDILNSVDAGARAKKEQVPK